MIGPGSLVIYKNDPAVVLEVAAKVTIKIAKGAERRVREKDILPIHPGPVTDIDALNSLADGEIETAWEMLQGTQTSLRELCDLAYDDFSPASAWTVWCEIADGDFFDVSQSVIRARDAAEVEGLRRERTKREESEARRRMISQRIRSGSIEPDDFGHLGEIEAVARGTSDKSPLMRDAGVAARPERAHALLLRFGAWGPHDNPYPSRYGLPVRSPRHVSGGHDSSERRDLRRLTSFAIDDLGTVAADDAVSFDDGVLWIHIADPASTVTPESPEATEAFDRGATLHCPDTVSHMLHESTIDVYTLGAGDSSKALSFAFEVHPSGEVELLEIVPSVVSVTRLSYEEADRRIEEPGLAGIDATTRRFAGWRQANAAPAIELPEAKVKVVGGRVEVTPLHFGRSRELVLESMLMVGFGVGRFAVTHGIAMPFSRQEEPELDRVPDTLATMWKARRRYKRSEHAVVPGAHAGVGLPVYIQATSPLRRYLDLLAHQQIRAFVGGGAPLEREEVTERIGGSDVKSADVRRVERLSDRHFTLAFLLENPGWSGTGVVVEAGRSTTVIVPSLGLEAHLVGSGDYQLDEEIEVEVESIRLPTLECYLAER